MTAGINYLVIVLIIILISLLVPFESKFNKNIKYLIIFGSLVPLSIVASIRTIGTDTFNYKRIFMEQEIINFWEYGLLELFSLKYEPGFLLIISIIKTLSLDYTTMFFVFFTIPTLLIIRVISKANIKNILLIYILFLLAYLLKGPMDIIRHFFAAALYLSALLAYSQRKKIISYLYIALSSFFHYSSIIGFIILLLLKIRWNIKRYLFVLIISFLSGFLLKDPFINWVIGSTNSEFALIEKVQIYADRQFSSDDIIIDILLNLIMIMPIILNVLIAIYGLKILANIKNKFISVLLNAQIIGTIITIFFMSTGSLIAGYRLDFFLSIGNFILMYYIICYSKRNNQVYVFLLFLYYLVAYNMVLILY